MKSIGALKAKLRRIPEAAEFDAGFAQLAYSEDYTRDRQLIRYILGRLTRTKLGLESLDYRQMTIEHIAPQSGDDLDGEHVASIGNLLSSAPSSTISWGRNRSRRRSLFSRRPMGYGRSALLDAAVSWSSDEVDSRAVLLAKVARDEVWKI